MHELRVGDVVMVDFEGQRKEGEVDAISEADRLVSVDTGAQSFYYSPNDLYPIALNDDELMAFGFEKQTMADGTVKYLKGPFRMLLSQPGNFTTFEMWYREDRRHIHMPLSVHQLQNHYHQMTKIDLARGVQAH